MKRSLDYILVKLIFAVYKLELRRETDCEDYPLSKSGSEGTSDRGGSFHRSKDNDVGIIRVMFPDNPKSEHDALTEISWDEFFSEFEERQLALLYDPESLFSKIIGRDTVGKRAEGEHPAHR
jgi:hypothetical protein